MSDTPRTDRDTHRYGDASVEWRGDWVPACACRIIERELNAANAEIEEKRKDVVWLATEKAKLENYVMRLEEAGDGLMKSINCGCPYGPSVFNCQTCTNSWDAWRKAKEAKP